MNIVSTGCLECLQTVHHPDEPNGDSLRLVFETSNCKGFRHVPSKHYIVHILDDRQDKVVAWCDKGETLTFFLMRIVPKIREFVEHSFESA